MYETYFWRRGRKVEGITRNDSLRRGCAGVQPQLSVAILRPGDSQRYPLPVPPSDVEDDLAAHQSQIFL